MFVVTVKIDENIAQIYTKSKSYLFQVYLQYKARQNLNLFQI